MGLGLALDGGILRSLYTGLFHCARRVRDNHWVWYNQILLLKQHSIPLHHTKVTHSDKLINNNNINPTSSDKITGNDSLTTNDNITFEDIANNQYYDPYICQSLYMPF